MRRPARIQVILLIAAVLAVACAAAQEKQRQKVRHVIIEGNTAFSGTRLVGLMLTRPSRFLARSYFHPEVFTDDLENLMIFYRQNGYLEAGVADTAVYPDTANRTVDVYIRLDEGALTRVEGVTVFGNEFFPDSVLRPLVRLAPGDPLRRRVIENAVVSLLSLYAEHGYLDASVTPNVQLNAEAHLAVVDFVIQERVRTRVGGIVVTGTAKTRRRVVERELLFGPGEIIRYSRLLESQRRLYLTGLFESVFVRPVASAASDSTKKDILIEIKEKASSELGVMVGYGSIEKIRGRVELNTINLAGTARQAGVAVEANFIKQGVTGSFSEPWTFGTRWRTDLTAYGEWRQEPGYHAETFGTRLTVGRRLTPHTMASIAYKFENTNLSEIRVAGGIEELHPRIRSLTLSTSHDSRDNLFDPQRGWYASWTNEVAGSFLQGSNTFARTVLLVKHFRPLGRETVIGSALEIGWMEPFGPAEQIPVNERFYAGGPTSLRGFGYQRVGPADIFGKPLGGRFKIVWNVIEVRRTLYKLFGSAAFLDLGGVWSDIDLFRLVDFRADLGAGLRVNSPVGIIRLDYGVNLDRRHGEPRGKIFLGMGQAF
ncbi:MAG TPA: BamA/TamA family outer membrane protein [Acidobacteriota bacterium]|nr:BamA/TamA family outer membrane protein [Acidobacteriota bacterium]